MYEYITEKWYLNLAISVISISLGVGLIFVDTHIIFLSVILFVLGLIHLGYMCACFLDMNKGNHKKKSKSKKTKIEDEEFEFVEKGYIPEKFNNIQTKYPYTSKQILEAFEAMDEDFDEALAKLDFSTSPDENLDSMYCLATIIGYDILRTEYSYNIKLMFKQKFKYLTKYRLQKLINELDLYDSCSCRGKMYYYGIKCKKDTFLALSSFSDATKLKSNVRFSFLLEFHNLYFPNDIKFLARSPQDNFMKFAAEHYKYKPAILFNQKTLEALDELKEIEAKEEEKRKLELQKAEEARIKREKELNEKAKKLRDERKHEQNVPVNNSDNSFYIKVAGVTFENRQQIVKTMHEGKNCMLVLDPYNTHDQNAVQVVYDEKRIGFVPRYHNYRIASHLRLGKPYKAKISAITGGENGRYLGVNILVTLIDETYEPQQNVNNNSQEDWIDEDGFDYGNFGYLDDNDYEQLEDNYDPRGDIPYSWLHSDDED